ncbi:hypothetical protein [Planococcus rifietoensis]|uniref:hypothetical protein n=1 Tax=Planococcus rifietoensis TaxID=200991 RepID=UPI0038509952
MANEKQDFTRDQLILKLSDELTDIRIIADSIKNTKTVLSAIAQDAEEKNMSQNQSHFLWDNNEQLQVVDDLLHRLVNEIYPAIEKADETQRMLSNLEKQNKRKGEK